MEKVSEVEYEQAAKMEDYASNEKIFYPPQKLPSSGVELLSKINNQVVKIEKAH
ncbi:hypothetical protein [Halobacteriovorax marinus]|uniref:hypothetical protein n=1 Tax=Halobacteriovorax marinus TaxID=97084 RepID=UPI0012FD9866|nr:hypothetical protein [Halobacteriovorax marinus]